MAFRRLNSDDGDADLSDEQQSVLACLEAGMGEEALSESTGLDPQRVAHVLQDLVELHVLQPAEDARFDGVPRHAEAPAAAEPEDDDDDRQPRLPTCVQPWTGDEMPEGTASSHDLHAPSTTSRDPGSVSSFPPRHSRPPALDELNYRRMYETRFRELEVGEREDVARHVREAELFALCLDPSPRVIQALLENSHFGLDHARVVALNHKTPEGLEILARRAQLVRDSHVQRRLMQNMQTPENVLERILRVKRLLDVYRLSIDRDLPERNRLRVRSRLRVCFTNAEPDERATLIIKTEGRCLANLAGCTFDGRTTQLLCNQSIVSTLFIQNLARFPATPAPLLAKLLRSPTVQRQPQLRTLLVRHPNAGSEWKRKP